MDTLVRKYFIDQGCNCAEATLRAVTERYGLEQTDMRLVSGFGGGCGCGLICGALAGSVAALGPMLVTECAHKTPELRGCCGRLCADFREVLGSTDCAELKPRYFREDIRCARVVETAVRLFGKLAEENGRLPAEGEA